MSVSLSVWCLFVVQHLDATERALVRDGELTETFNCTESHRVVLFLFTGTPSACLF